MFLKEIYQDAVHVYNSIPGSTLQSKIYQHLPSVTAAYAINYLIPATLTLVVSVVTNPLVSLTLNPIARLSSSRECPHNPASIASLPEHLRKTALITLIIFQLKQGYRFMNRAVNTTQFSEKLRQILLIYLTFNIAYNLFKKILPPNRPRPVNQEPLPSRFACASFALSFALQLKYAPSATLDGMIFGAFISSRANHLEFFSENQTMFSAQVVKTLLRPYKGFINPKTARERFYYSLDSLSLASMSVTEDAFFAGLRQGKFLLAAYRYCFEKK